MARSFSQNLAANLYQQLSLLGEAPSGPNGAGSHHDVSLASQRHSLITTPVFTAAAGLFVDKHCPAALNQYGLLGRALELVDPGDVRKRAGDSSSDDSGFYDGARKPEKKGDPRVFLNGNAPWSAFICGLQGSGKSHTLACMLENMLVKSPILGALPNPLTAMVFHFDINNSANALRPCEAAYLATHMPVRILVSSSNYPQMSRLYSGIASQNLIVKPLKLKQSDLNIERMLSLMSVDKNSDHPPLYMEYVRKILRELATASSIYGSGFDYRLFRDMILQADLTPMQRGPLTLRLEILESFLEMQEDVEEVWDFTPGVITIVDLSDPFVDEASACALFDICVGLFLEKDVKYGRVIALDEAHKYMTSTSPAQKLTDNLLSVIRQQRHLATRVLISTQEPTISPKLLDLCNIIIAHRFTSPEWLAFMKRHLAAVAVESDANALSLLARIVALNEGEAYVFAPAGIVSTNDFEQDRYFEDQPEDEDDEDDEETEDVRKLGMGYLKIKVRKRLTEDGGKSILANSAPVTGPAPFAGTIPQDVIDAMLASKVSSRGGRGGRGGGRGGRGGARGGGDGGGGEDSYGRLNGRAPAPPPQQQQQQQAPLPQRPNPPQAPPPQRPNRNSVSNGNGGGVPVYDQWGTPQTEQSGSGWDAYEGVQVEPHPSRGQQQQQQQQQKHPLPQRPARGGGRGGGRAAQAPPPQQQNHESLNGNVTGGDSLEWE